MPEPVREPLLKSLASIFFPLMAQKRVVPGVTFLVSTVVVRVLPSLTASVEVLITALEMREKVMALLGVKEGVFRVHSQMVTCRPPI